VGLKTKEITEKAQTQFPKGLVVAMFFVLVALMLVFAVVAVLQIRMAQFNKRMAQFNKRMHVVEDSVTRIEDGMSEFVGVIERYERALDLPEIGDGRIEVGNRKR